MTLRYFRSDFSRQSMIINRLLRKIRLRLCKDCQKLTSSKDLRCKNCRIEHDEYMRERLMQEYQDDLRAEYEANEAENNPENDDHDLKWTDLD